METKEKIEFAGLPLAVYREIAAHLRQVEGLEVGLIPQSSLQFDYYQSQIEGLWISWKSSPTTQNVQLVQQILAYYRNRYSL
ncbi:hypothetical protein NIES22_27860 [Calothrix brevissima NIES-22]|nr:hypothetical protein NIES22_27860 [Calothrix brevissima NIES-22]